jgi:hypothetical protein
MQTTNTHFPFLVLLLLLLLSSLRLSVTALGSGVHGHSGILAKLDAKPHKKGGMVPKEPQRGLDGDIQAVRQGLGWIGILGLVFSLRLQPASVVSLFFSHLATIATRSEYSFARLPPSLLVPCRVMAPRWKS